MAAADTDPGPIPAWLSWSSGKDSAYALEVVRREGRYRVDALLTTTSRAFRRVAMHGVREELLERQAESLGLPLVKVPIPYPCPNDVYEREMGRVLETARDRGVRHIVFGDLFLREVRQYREERLASAGMRGVFPLWERPTGPLARQMHQEGIRARICCIDPRQLSPSWAGRVLDPAALDSLPPAVDPCGERGAFHTFVTDAPAFRAPVEVAVGEIVERDGFVFADLRPA